MSRPTPHRVPRILPALIAVLLAAAFLALACEAADDETIDETLEDPIDGAGPGVPLTPEEDGLPASPVAPVDFGENCAVSWREAIQYIGLDVTLQGPVVDVSEISTPRGSAVRIAVGGEPADAQGVAVIIPAFAVDRFNPPPQELFDGERICVRGYVSPGPDRLQIYVGNPDDIAVLPEAVPTPVLPGGQCDEPIPWEQAGEHAGEIVDIRGPVVGSRVETAQPNDLVILEVGATAPDEGGFDVAIPFYALEDFNAPPREFYAGETICVQGAVTVVDGRPRTYVDRQDSIFVQ